MKCDIVCFSHLRWHFVYQRPHHLLSRFASTNRVFFIEEPVYGSDSDVYKVTRIENKFIWVVVPHLRDGLSADEKIAALAKLMDELVLNFYINYFISWYYSPMALAFTSHLLPSLVVYDCMDELAAFNNAPLAMVEMETELFKKADIVFTGGYNLYKAKKSRHSNIYPIPSSVDLEHFQTARAEQADPADQATIAHPRLGYYGVIDERLNLSLLDELAKLRPDWNFVLVGPVIKIDPATLPLRNNIHYLGSKDYKELPAYLAGWDLAIMPFALNDATRFISPTKTPEFLAGGKQVISTAIADVVEPYGREGLVYIADAAAGFIHAAEKALDEKYNKALWLSNVDLFLSNISWDKTWQTMQQLILLALDQHKIIHPKTTNTYV